MSLSSYITHPTGAGPRGPPAHKGAPLGHLYPKVAHIFMVILPIIITIQNKKWLPQLQITIFYTTTIIIHSTNRSLLTIATSPSWCFFLATIHHHFHHLHSGASSSSSLETYRGTRNNNKHINFLATCHMLVHASHYSPTNFNGVLCSTKKKWHITDTTPLHK